MRLEEEIENEISRLRIVKLNTSSSVELDGINQLINCLWWKSGGDYRPRPSALFEGYRAIWVEEGLLESRSGDDRREKDRRGEAES